VGTIIGDVIVGDNDIAVCGDEIAATDNLR
jgi:hypothetical protein